MTLARKKLISLDDTPYYHCVCRCVRRAFLWGTDHFSGRDYSHRKQWVVDRLTALQKIFAIDICAYAVMSNHYHVVIYVDRDRAKHWTKEEVIDRWTQLFGLPVLVERYLRGQTTSQAEADKALAIIAQWRERLHDISWFMRCLNEHLARLANKEDHCKGRFWEGRFKSQALLDEAGLLTCMAYVDLNPIRAGMAKSPETSDFTSIQERIRHFKQHKNTQSSTMRQFRRHRQDDDSLPFYLTDYFDLVDWTGRAMRADKRGAIPDTLPPILARLNIAPDHWLNYMQPAGNVFTHAIGRTQQLKTYALSLGQMWLHGLGPSQRLFN
jgi:REP element-mobilizing transposase RayT